LDQQALFPSIEQSKEMYQIQQSIIEQEKSRKPIEKAAKRHDG